MRGSHGPGRTFLAIVIATVALSLAPAYAEYAKRFGQAQIDAIRNAK